ncbi:MAG: hypothetical protein SGPRY_014200, partial [Prymnesium sp.]
IHPPFIVIVIVHWELARGAVVGEGRRPGRRGDLRAVRPRPLVGGLGDFGPLAASGLLIGWKGAALIGIVA